MRKLALYIFCLSLYFPKPAAAQEALENSPQYQALEKLNFLVGNWAGQGISYDADGVASEYFDTEFVRYDLSGEILLINANGYANGKISYQLHTVIHYDIAAKKYVYSPYSANGTRPFTCDLVSKRLICLNESQDFRLTFQRLTDGIWNEYGERHYGDGWRKTFETKLSPVQ